MAAVLVKIGNQVWEFSRADLKRYSPDALTLKLRAKSARTRFVQISGEWFRTGGLPRFDDSTAATPAERKKIAKAIELPNV